MYNEYTQSTHSHRHQQTHTHAARHLCGFLANICYACSDCVFTFSRFYAFYFQLKMQLYFPRNRSIINYLVKFLAGSSTGTSMLHSIYNKYIHMYFIFTYFNLRPFAAHLAVEMFVQLIRANRLKQRRFWL